MPSKLRAKRQRLWRQVRDAVWRALAPALRDNLPRCSVPVAELVPASPQADDGPSWPQQWGQAVWAAGPLFERIGATGLSVRRCEASDIWRYAFDHKVYVLASAQGDPRPDVHDQEVQFASVCLIELGYVDLGHGGCS